MIIYFEDIDVKIDYEEYGDALKNNLYELQKWSYILGKAKESGKIGNERRIAAVERGITKLASTIADQLSPIFVNWLENHAILSPETFAKKRLDDALDVYGSNYKIFESILEITNGIENEDYRIPFDDRYIYKKIINTPELFDNSELQSYLELNIEDLKEYQDDDGIKETYQKMLDDNDYRSMFDVVSEMGMDSFWRNYFEQYSDGILQDMFQYIYFPAWYGKWSAQGIDETRDRIEKAYEHLENIDSYDVSDKVVYLNHVVNISHQTGDMVDYIENNYDISKKYLDYLSNIPDDELDQWEDEAREEGLI